MFVTLMYHLIDERIVHPMSVPLHSFREHLAVLNEMDVSLLTLADVNAALEDAYLPSGGVLITFDDGYRNSIDTALTVLEEARAPALISLCSAYLRPETRPPRTVHVSQEFSGVSEIKAWLDTGRDIAGHSYDHPRLTDLSDEEATAQVATDKRILEDTFARSIDTFVYPFGAVDKRVEQIVGRYYRNAFSDSAGCWPAPDCRLAMRRMRVRPEWTPLEFHNEIELALTSRSSDQARSFAGRS